MAQPSNVPRLLAEIEAALPKRILSTAWAIAPDEPVYTVIVCYSDNTSNQHMPLVMVAPERIRQWARKHACVSQDIWKPHVELSGSAKLLKTKFLQDPEVQTRIAACYDELTAPGNADESILLLPFRQMMWRVANTLNAMDWKRVLQPTDDFVVIASDESGFQVQEDARNSLPEGKRLLLESRRAVLRKSNCPRAGRGNECERPRAKFLSWPDSLGRMGAGPN